MPRKKSCRGRKTLKKKEHKISKGLLTLFWQALLIAGLVWASQNIDSNLQW